MTDDVMYNGYVLSDFLQVIDVGKPSAGRVNSTKQVSGMDGTLLTGSTLAPVTIPVTFLLSEMDMTERRERIRELSYMIRSREPARLEFASDNGLYYMAVPDGEVPIQDHVRAGKVVVGFRADSPILYGAERSVTVPSGGSARIMVGGTYPTEPTITGSLTGDSTADHVWGLRVDEGSYLHVSLGNGQREVVADCERCVVTVDGTVTLPTLDSDWLRLDIGPHTLANDVGSGACTVTWRERWS